MSGRDDDVPHYCAHPGRRQARRVPLNALEISGLTVRHGDVLAVEGLDLRIGAGETVALLGPNGAGKSSTVSAVLGLVRPAAGTVNRASRPTTPGRPVLAPTNPRTEPSSSAATAQNCSSARYIENASRRSTESAP